MMLDFLSESLTNADECYAEDPFADRMRTLSTVEFKTAVLFGEMLQESRQGSNGVSLSLCWKIGDKRSVPGLQYILFGQNLMLRCSARPF